MSLNDQNKGCLEVKCPLVCEKMAFADASKTVTGFALCQMCLSKSHGFYYQIQTQMHITHLPWCDLVVWSPYQEPFMQHVQYDAFFMKTALVKKACYFLF